MEARKGTNPAVGQSEARLFQLRDGIGEPATLPAEVAAVRHAWVRCKHTSDDESDANVESLHCAISIPLPGQVREILVI